MRISKEFRQPCGRVGSLPSSRIIPRNLIQTAEHPVVSDAFADVWKGVYNGKRVEIKALCVYEEDNVRKVRKVIHSVFPGSLE